MSSNLSLEASPPAGSNSAVDDIRGAQQVKIAKRNIVGNLREGGGALTFDQSCNILNEDWDGQTLCYHTAGDRLSALDLDYYADCICAAIVTIAHMGRLMPSDGLGQLFGTVCDLGAGHPLSGVTVAALWPVYQDTCTTPIDASEGLFSVPPCRGAKRAVGALRVASSRAVFPGNVGKVLCRCGSTVF